MTLSSRKSVLIILAGGGLLGLLLVLILSRVPRTSSNFTLKALPLGQIRPRGWLEGQLRIQANGLTGHLDEFWPDIRDSGWIGGKGEGWERGPYWLDGLVPLAYELQDPALLLKVRRWMDYILSHQTQDGWLGPEQSPPSKLGYNFPYRDPWPAFVAAKGLIQYAEAEGDPRVVPALLAFLRHLDFQLSRRALFSWSHFRSTELVFILDWMRDRIQDPVLDSLARKEKEQGYDWKKHFADLPVKERSRGWTYEGHVVNNAMGLKGSGNRKEALAALAALDRWHGQASGLFSGDECFAGKMPSQGTELCAVVEMMFSLENLGGRFAEQAFFERLEKVAYNALPATFKKDGWAHQYVQQANQPIAALAPDKIYTTNDPDANTFGLEPNYGCCTANMHQGWPKFTSHLWYASSDGGLAAAAWAPCALETLIKGSPVRVEVRTDYPFSDRIDLALSVENPVRFPLYLRIPSWARGARLTISGEKERSAPAGHFLKLDRNWVGRKEMTLVLPMKLRVERRFNKAVSLERGPLVYSLRIKERWQYLKGLEPHADWEVFPESPWNYALELDESHPEKSFQISQTPAGLHPFSPEGSPLHLRGKAKRLPGWILEHGTAAPPPESPVTSDQPLEEVELIPYGCTNLRMTELPVLSN